MPPILPHSRRTFIAGLAAAGISLINPPDLLSIPQIERSPAPVASLNPPRHRRLQGSSLVCTADPKTDFWRKTFYSYIIDNAHFYYRRMSGDFTTTLKVSGQYNDLYDQAGLIVRIDAENWMKCDVEFVNGRQNMSVVYTREYSSWATRHLPEKTPSLWLKVVRKGPALDIFHSLDGSTFEEPASATWAQLSRPWSDRCAPRPKARASKCGLTTGA